MEKILKKVDVSVIVPVYNVEPYIESCLESISCQTFHGNLECLIIDDCGDDNSILLVESFIKQYKGRFSFNILYHDINLGLSAARNTGIRESNADWIYFLDSDDHITPNCIEDLFNCTKRYPQVQMVQAGAICDYSERAWLNLENPQLPEYVDDPRWICKSYLQERFLPMTAWNRLVRRDFLVAHSLFFEEGMINEDVLWTYRLSRAITDLAILRKNTYYYLLREGSISSDKETLFRNRLKILEKKVDYYEEIDNKYHDLEFLSISSQLIQNNYIDFYRIPSYVYKSNQLLKRLSVSAKFWQKIGIGIYCLSPQFVRQRIHFLKVIKFLLGISVEWE